MPENKKVYGIQPRLSYYIAKYGNNYWYEYQKAIRKFNLEMIKQLKHEKA